MMNNKTEFIDAFFTSNVFFQETLLFLTKTQTHKKAHTQTDTYTRKYKETTI